MGWNLCIATDEDREKALALNRPSYRASDDDYEVYYQGFISLSRHFLYELVSKDGQLGRYLTSGELNLLGSDHIDQPDQWRARDTKSLSEIIYKVREQLSLDNNHLPLEHFLWFVDEKGKRWNGSTQLTLPFGGIKLKVPHDPIVKLDGGHHDPKHRYKLRKYEVRVDPDLLAQFNRKVEQIIAERSLHGEYTTFFGSFGPQMHPLVEHPIGWVLFKPIKTLDNFSVCKSLLKNGIKLPMEVLLKLNELQRLLRKIVDFLSTPFYITILISSISLVMSSIKR